MPASILEARVETNAALAAQQLAAFGQQVQKVGTTGTAAMSRFTDAQKAAFTGLAVAGSAALKGAIDKTQQLASETRKLATQLGLTAEEASKLRAAGQLLGVSTDSLIRSFGIFSKHLVDGGAAFAKYGIALKDASGANKPFLELLSEVSDRFNALPPGVERTAFVMDVFGKSGRDLIPILSRGSAGLKELYDKAKDLGLVMNNETLAASKALTLAQNELSAAFDGAKIVVGQALIPVMTALADALTPLVSAFVGLPGPLQTLTAAVIVLGAAFGKFVVAAGVLSNILPWLGAKLGGTAAAMAANAAATDAAAEAMTLYTASASGAVTSTVAVGAAVGSRGLLGAILAVVAPLALPALVAGLGALAAHSIQSWMNNKRNAKAIKEMSDAMRAGAVTADQLNQALAETDLPEWAKAQFRENIDKAAASVADTASAVQDLTSALPDASETTSKLQQEAESLASTLDPIPTILGDMASASQTAADNIPDARKALEDLRDSGDASKKEIRAAEDALSGLGEQSKITAKEIIDAFAEGLKATRDLGANVQTLVDRGAPLELVNQLAQFPKEAAAVANASPREFDRIIRQFILTQEAAQDTADDIAGIGIQIFNLPNGKNIAIRLTGSTTVTRQLNDLRNAIYTLPSSVSVIPNAVGHRGGAVTPAGIFHSGGAVPQFHSGGDVPAILQTGEFVMSRTAVNALGVNTLRAMNAMKTSGSASGGSHAAPMAVTINAGINGDATDIQRELEWWDRTRGW